MFRDLYQTKAHMEDKIDGQKHRSRTCSYGSVVEGLIWQCMPRLEMKMGVYLMKSTFLSYLTNKLKTQGWYFNNILSTTISKGQDQEQAIPQKHAPKQLISMDMPKQTSRKTRQKLFEQILNCKDDHNTKRMTFFFNIWSTQYFNAN